VDEAFVARLRSGRSQSAAGAQHRQPAPRWRGPSPPGVSPQGRENETRGRGRGRAQQPRRFYCLFHGEDCAHPTRDCPETKATRDRMARRSQPTTLGLSRTHISNPLRHTSTAPLRIHRITHTSTTKRYKSYLPHPHLHTSNNKTSTTPTPQSKRTSPISRIAESFI
jgi:hypothetical protein